MKDQLGLIFKGSLLFCIVIFFSLKISLAQDSSSKNTYVQTLNLGFGGGVDYGGLGIRLSALPDEHLAFCIQKNKLVIFGIWKY